MGVGSMAYSEALQKELKEAKADQPWLDPNDEELPPIDEELSSAATAEQSEKAGQVIKSVSLDLDEGEEEEEEEAGAKDEKGAKENAPVSNKELALQAALEAKYNLAKSFVGIGHSMKRLNCSTKCVVVARLSSVNVLRNWRQRFLSLRARIKPKGGVFDCWRNKLSGQSGLRRRI